MATTFWSETWTGADGALWPAGWFTEAGGAAATTIVGGKGRITAGPGSYTRTRARLRRMDEQRDFDVRVSFTPNQVIEWYLTVGARGPGSDTTNDDVLSGVSVRIDNLLGSRLSIRNGDASVLQTPLGTAELPAQLDVGTTYRLRFVAQGRQLRAKLWDASSPEPSTWQIDVTDPGVVMARGKVWVSFVTNSAGAVQYMDLDDFAVLGLDPVLPAAAEPAVQHTYTMWSRAADYSPDVALPIISIKGVKQHLGVDAVVIETKYDEERWLSLQPSRGVLLFRDGKQKFTGRVRKRTRRFDRDSGQLRIRVEAVSEEDRFGKALVFPDPLRAADDQTVNDYWMTRTAGVATAKAASTAMMQLISDQAGPTCRADRQIPGLVLGADPAVGVSRVWSGLFTSAGDRGVLDQLAAIAAASGENLGIRMTSGAGSLTVDIVQPRDLADAVRFSADLGNLVGYEYSEEEPDCTDAVAAGQGDLHLRLRKHVTTASAVALAWGIRAWKYVDRRDTADVAELTKSATDAVTEGDAKVSLSVTLTDSQAATYDVDWDLGDVITIYVDPPDQATSASVTDVVREVVFEVDDKGKEEITPTIGTLGASSLPEDSLLRRLTEVGSALGGLVSRK